MLKYEKTKDFVILFYYITFVTIVQFYNGGKTVYAFTANAGSRFADSISRIQAAEPEATVIEGVSVSEKEMADAKEEVLSCVRGFAETKPVRQAGTSNDENSEEMENITNMKMNVQIGNKSFIAALEDNATTRELIEMMRQGPVSIDMSDYSGFEKGVIPESEKSRICPVGKKRLEAAALQQYLLLRNREDSASLQKRYWWSPNHYQHRAMYGCIWLCVFRFLSALQHLTLSIDL